MLGTTAEASVARVRCHNMSSSLRVFGRTEGDRARFHFLGECSEGSSVERSCFHWCTANAICLNAESCAQACAYFWKAGERSTSVISCHGDGGCIGVSTRAAGSCAGARRPQRADLGDEVAHQRVTPLGGCLTEVNRDNGVCRQNFWIFVLHLPAMRTDAQGIH